MAQTRHANGADWHETVSQESGSHRCSIVVPEGEEGRGGYFLLRNWERELPFSIILMAMWEQGHSSSIALWWFVLCGGATKDATAVEVSYSACPPYGVWYEEGSQPICWLRPNCGYGSFKLGIGSYNSALSIGLLEDTLEALANIVPSVCVEQLPGNAPSLGVGDVVLLAVVEDVEKAAQPSPRDFVAVSELVGSPPAMENPSVLCVT
ncbi:hypothetical protein FH972_001925 [Carpinus fangiana]|uniref:Uncharacterized protein n=1 Tax=Carpinus fangiana TaxID=176857 RepID=A0A5N6QDA1_9ROSI|nr:hypothetical protein FH972_001925 [Carpinus fangiana]